ncbi:hypothetical protein DFH08DRAFT_828096 [Mycena albidolilacea]|uniref:Uncharacterized protein n=1 Tax=Mycena albidolilacea TaxID=1033008 RepID=A0AAD6YXP0_9AGAR|nr:hypothetical protein DFH08DRAFT_828096 [Mycena albidolilacea]
MTPHVSYLRGKSPDLEKGIGEGPRNGSVDGAPKTMIDNADRIDSLRVGQDIRRRRKLRAKSSEHDIEERNENVPLSNANALPSQKARQGAKAKEGPKRKRDHRKRKQGATKSGSEDNGRESMNGSLLGKLSEEIIYAEEGASNTGLQDTQPHGGEYGVWGGEGGQCYESSEGRGLRKDSAERDCHGWRRVDCLGRRRRSGGGKRERTPGHSSNVWRGEIAKDAGGWVLWGGSDVRQDQPEHPERRRKHTMGQSSEDRTEKAAGSLGNARAKKRAYDDCSTSSKSAKKTGRSPWAILGGGRMLTIRRGAGRLGVWAGTDGGETIETEHRRPRANQLGEGTHQDSNARWCPVRHKEPSRDRTAGPSRGTRWSSETGKEGRSRSAKWQ